MAMFDLKTVDDVFALEEAILAEPQIELETEHFFAHGTYTRVLHLPKDTVLTGKIHRHSCINILAKGKMMVVTAESEYEIEAPFTFVSGAGVKKAGYVIEDAVWINVHPWSGAEDMQLVEQEIIMPELLT